MASDTTNPRMLGMQDICEMIGIGRRTLQTWRNRGLFPTPDLKLGQTVRWNPATVERFLNENSPALRAERPLTLRRKRGESSR